MKFSKNPKNQRVKIYSKIFILFMNIGHWSINGLANCVDTEAHFAILGPYPVLGVGAKHFFNTVLAPANEP